MVEVCGRPAGSASARGLLGWVPQDLALYPLLTCRENLEIIGRYQGLRGKVLAENVAWCLEWSALAERADSVAKNLSGGMKRRLNMAMGIVHRPGLVLMDEPTVGVDPQSRNRIFEMIGALRSAGASVLYTTHYMEEAERLCDRIVIIDHGRIIAEGTAAELIERTFGGRNDLTLRFAPTNRDVKGWMISNGGTDGSGAARFSVDQPTTVAALISSAERFGLEVVDVNMTRPTLESVFLRLTGRSLRE